MNELKNRIDALKQKLSDNIENQYATTYEESEIAEVDNSVINEVLNYLDYIDTMKIKADVLKGVAEKFNYENTSSDLSGLSKSISDYEINHSDMPKEILKASKEAFDELARDFDSCKEGINECIDRAEQNYNNAITYKNKRDSYDTDSEDYNKYNDLYEGQLKKGNSECSTAEGLYESLIKMFNLGLKKTSTVVSIDDSLTEEENSVRHVENMQISGNIMPYLFNTYGSILFTGTVDKNGIPIEGVFEYDGVKGKINRSFDENGTCCAAYSEFYAGDGHIHETREESYENGNCTNKTVYYADDGHIEYISERSYDENGNCTKKTGVSYAGDGHIYETSEVSYENGNCTKDTHVWYADDGITIIRTSESSYDENGNCTKDTDVSYADDGNIESTRERLYDENDNWTKQTEVWYADDGNIESTCETLRDENGNWTKKTGVEYADDGITIIKTYETLYDENGNETSTTYFNPDGSIITD